MHLSRTNYATRKKQWWDLTSLFRKRNGAFRLEEYDRLMLL